ncbi:sodium-coupled monocarboxylate transporter 1 isoform X4 [Anabrus simplex]|uniref:sodium-coupled monocarboxylate transporter 1 isoform X4 n=1 Tax=Anabrus simplex TaxID=316456 RepID=UPI0035A333D8
MTGTTVEELGSMLQRFAVADYIVFTLMLLICAVIGVYYGFFNKQVTSDDYLVGGRKMKIFPVSMSLIASFISGITLLGTPTEIYLYGTQYLYIGIGVVLMGFAMTYVYLPVLHDLQLTSTYEYLELRFNKQARLFGSVLFVISSITWIPIVIYVPALAFNQVTGVNVHVVTPLVCVICIFYTCVGGLKAVVWTDVIQTIIMFGAMILVAVKGSMDVGGAAVVWQRNLDSGRIELPNSMSTAMNSMAAVILEDFYKPFFAKPLTERQTSVLMKAVVIIFGFVCVALVFVVEKLGSVLQMAMSLGAITNGPSLGLFSIGFFLPWVTFKGMVAGGVVSLGFMSWIILGAQTAIATGRMVYQTKPLTVEGCTYEFLSSNTTFTTQHASDMSDVFVLFRISYLWYTVLGAVVTMVVSLVVSFATGPNDPRDADRRLLSPVVRWMMPQHNTEDALSKGYKPVELLVIEGPGRHENTTQNIEE